MSVAQAYSALVASGGIERDPAQARVVAMLDQLLDRLSQHRLSRKSSALGWLFSKREAKSEPIRGLYIWGEVGRGKTMLMDLFYEALPAQRKRRAHFHAFMADVHERIFAFREREKRGEIAGGDPIGPVAEALADEAWVLCFDEFAVTDIADAMILGRLFKAMFARGIVVVATSNVEPSLLYRDGLNRSLFLPFIDMLKERMEIVKLEARADFRLEKLGGEPVFYTPADYKARVALDVAFARLTGSAKATPATIALKGRTIAVPRQALGVARFDFADLCDAPLGASDYLAIARNYHTVILENVPRLTFERRNPAKRFITLIDVLYERHVKLLMSAETDVDALYAAERGHEAFEFARTASRLIEMRSEAYLALPQGAVDSTASGATTGIVET
ncbi:MAG: cell division protein ZapE [Rhizobiales bacterium 65-9]|nr:AFG1 family ATPase [Hyphomicrobiales bacterium]OJY36449.1 MAG: cell division protein ZapE [Rhizobiales bacterium 65-9]